MTQATPTLRQRLKAICQLSWPIVAAMVSQNAMNLVDTAMVGTLGAVSLAAVGLASMAIWVMTGLLQGMGSAVQAMTARRYGEESHHRLHEAMANAFYLIVGFGIPYALLLLGLSSPLFRTLTQDLAVREQGIAYLDIRLYTIPVIGLNFAFRGYFNGLHRPKLYMLTLLIMHPVNIALNYVLIFGKFGFPGMGVRGAALGTAIATTLGCMVFFYLMVRERHSRFSLAPTVLKGKALMDLLRLAAPSGFQSLTLAAGYLMFFKIAGMVSTQALAGVNILVNLALICILISMGFGLGTLTLVSNALGKAQRGEAIAWVKSSVLLVSCLVGTLGLLFALFPGFWLSLFIRDPEVIQAALVPMILMGLSQSYDGAAMVLMHAHLGGGAAKSVMVISLVNQWLIFLPGCYIWVYFFDGQLVHLYVCMVLYRLFLFLSFFFSIRQGKWLSIQI